MTGRLALAACRVILAACYAGAVLAPARLVAVTEILLLSLLAAVTAAAWWRHRAPRPSPSFGPGPAAGPLSTRREPGPAAGAPRKAPPVTIDSVPRGPGLYAMTREGAGRAITNVRKLAGGQGRPGQGLINTATILLGMLAAGLFAVSLAAQYQYIWHAKHQGWPAVIEAVALDAGMAIFSLLALGLARAGQSARIERALIVVCACGSAAMNYAAADVTSPRSVLAYTMPPVFLAIVADRVIASVRRHVLGMDAGRSAWAALGRAALAVLAVFGKAMLYSLRFVLAPRSTFAGLRRCVLIAAPLPSPLAGLAGPDSGTGGGREEQPWPMCLLKTGPDGTGKVCSRPRPCPRHEPQVPLPGETKKAHLRRLYTAHPRCGDQPSASRIAAELAPHVRLGEGTARAYIYQFLADQQETP